MIKATLTKGGKPISGTGIEKVAQPENAEPSSEYVKVNTKQGTKDVDMIVVNTIRMLKAGRLNYKVAASIIVGRIRVRFVNAIRRNKENSRFEYEISSFKYLDEILFDDLMYIITTVFQYSSQGTLSIPQVMRMITDTSNVIEYYIPEDDLNDIRNILGAVYSEF